MQVSASFSHCDFLELLYSKIMEPSLQLSPQSGEEKKYVTLETGSRLSGYTQDYLERLCRLNKIDYRLWNNGQFVIELNSLLNETHTILLSYDGISFVDKGELADPVPKVVGTMLSSALKEMNSVAAMPPPPVAFAVSASREISNTDDREQRGSPLLMSRSPDLQTVSSQEKIPEVKMELPTPPPSVPIASVEGKDAIAFAPSVIRATMIEVPLPAAVAVPIKQSLPLFIPRPLAVSQPTDSEIASEVHHDDWDVLLLGGHPLVLEEKSAPAPVHGDIPASSLYHPIQTSIDPSAHYDPAPLFPVLNPTGIVKLAKRETQEHLVVVVPKPPVDTYGPGQRVIVYAPEDLLKNTKKEEIPVTPPAEKSEGSNPPLSIPIPPPQVPATIIRSAGAVPSLRVMPGLPDVPLKNLPMNTEEHHLSAPTPHALMKKTGSVLGLATILMISSVFFLGSVLPAIFNRLSPQNNAAVYVAGAAAALSGPEQNEPASSGQANELILPFSDQVVVSLGTAPNSIIVRPVFKDKTGRSYEYAIVPVATTSKSKAR